MFGHGGLFKTKGVGQRIAAAAMNTPVSVMDTAGEGGAWGIALLAAFMKDKEKEETLQDYLNKKIFAGQTGSSMEPDRKDVEGFEPLAKAYGLPGNTQEDKEIRNKIMEEALSEACQVPIKIMETIYEVILLHEELAKKGTKIAISDVAAGVQLCRSSLYSASVNVFINTKSMKNPKTAQELNLRANNLLEKGIKKADTIFYEVFDTLRPDKQGE